MNVAMAVLLVVLVVVVPVLLAMPRRWLRPITDQRIMQHVLRQYSKLAIVEQALSTGHTVPISYTPEVGWAVSVTDAPLPPFMNMIYQSVFSLNRLRLSRYDLTEAERDNERKLWEWELRAETTRITRRLLNEHIGCDLLQLV